MSFWDDVASVGSAISSPYQYIANQFSPALGSLVGASNPVNATRGVIAGNLPKFFGASGGGNAYSSDSNAAARYADIEAGNAAGKKEFYDDPDMQMLRKKREGMADGYDGKEYGALRQSARDELKGQRSSYLNTLSSNLARGGVGGARAAAIRGAADQKFAAQNAENERKLLLDSARMKREGTNDLQDFLFRQKYGMLGTGLGYGQLGATDRGTAAAAAANQPAKKGFLGSIFDGLF